MAGSRFKMVAYSGATIELSWWGRVIFDLSGIRLDDKLPALREHLRDRVVGTIDGHSAGKGALTAQGYFMGTPDGLEVAGLIKEGFPYQASIGVFPETVEELTVGESAQVNGSTFHGPGIIVRQSHVREISFVALGADAGTSVAALAATAGAGLVAGATADFMAGVRSQMSKGLQVRPAILAAARQHPALYESYLEEIGLSNREYLDLPVSGSGFEAKVEQFMSAGLSRGQATIKTARDFPELQADFLKKINKGVSHG